MRRNCIPRVQLGSHFGGTIVMRALIRAPDSWKLPSALASFPVRRWVECLAYMEAIRRWEFRFLRSECFFSWRFLVRRDYPHLSSVVQDCRSAVMDSITCDTIRMPQRRSLHWIIYTTPKMNDSCNFLSPPLRMPLLFGPRGSGSRANWEPGAGKHCRLGHAKSAVRERAALGFISPTEPGGTVEGKRSSA